MSPRLSLSSSPASRAGKEPCSDYAYRQPDTHTKHQVALVPPKFTANTSGAKIWAFLPTIPLAWRCGHRRPIKRARTGTPVHSTVRQALEQTTSAAPLLAYQAGGAALHLPASPRRLHISTDLTTTPQRRRILLPAPSITKSPTTSITPFVHSVHVIMDSNRCDTQLPCQPRSARPRSGHLRYPSCPD